MAERGAFLRLGERGSRSVVRGLRNIDRSLGEIERSGRKTSTSLRRSFSGVAGSARGLFGALGGVGVVIGAKRILTYQQRLGQLQAKMRAPTEDMRGLADQVKRVGEQFNLSKEDVLGAVEIFQDVGGEVTKQRAILGQLAAIAKATSTPMADLARITSTFVAKGIAPENAVQILRDLSKQADVGFVSMKDLSRVIAEAAGTAGGLGDRLKGVEGVRRVGQLMQVAGTVFAGKAEESRTAVVALLRDLTNASRKLGKGKKGVKVFDDKGMRDVNVIMTEILKKTRGKVAGKGGLASIFTADSLKVALAFKDAFDFETGAFKREGVVGKVGAARGTEEDIQRALTLRTQGIAREAEQAEGALRKVSNALDAFGADVIRRIGASPGGAVATAGAAVAAAKFGPAILRGILGFITRRRGGVAGAGAAGAGGAAGLLPGGGVTPVFVVNMPGATLGQAAGFFGPGGGALGGAAGGAAKGLRGLLTATTTTGKALQATGIVGMFAGVAAAGFQFGTMLDQLLGLSDKISDFALGFNKRAADERVKKFAEERGSEAVVNQARELAALAKAGVKTVQTRGGDRVALNEENIRKILAEQGAAQGLTPEAMKALGAEINKALRGAITVKPAGGVDKVDVEVGRGPAR